MSLTVSVVVPTRDRRALLEGALASLERQRVPPAEVIVVSDGSVDGTEELVRARNLRLVRTEGIGAGGARNAGWRVATGDIVAFLDDDCVADPEWLGRVVGPLTADASVGIAQGRTLPARDTGPRHRSLTVTSETGLYETCNIAYRRQALEDAGGFNERLAQEWGHMAFGEDVELAWRVKRAGWRSVFVDDAVVQHHVFEVGLRSVLGRQWDCWRFPSLVKRVPELRDLLPGGRWFLRRQSPWAQLALLGLVMSLRAPVAGALLAGPYAAWVLRNVGVVGAPRQVVLDLVTSAALIKGSLESRSLVL